MPACPMCNKPLRELTRKCPTCQADLDLLVDYSTSLKSGLEKAEDLTRNGDLAQAIWSYLEVLEVDPDNPAARRQVGQIVTAVRQFDAQSPLRRMGDPSQNGSSHKKALSPQMLRSLFFGGAFVLIFALGVILGFVLATGNIGADPVPPPPQPPPTLGP